MHAAEIKNQIDQLQAKLDEMYPSAVIRAAETIKVNATELDVTVAQFFDDVREELGIRAQARKIKAPAKKTGRAVYVLKRNPKIVYRGGKPNAQLKAEMIADGIDPSDAEQAQQWRAENLSLAA